MNILGVLALAIVADLAAPVSPDLRPDYYDTMDEAATAAVELSYQRSNSYEYAGIILRTPGGKYRISDPDTDYRGDSVSIDFDNDYDTYKLAGWYHTHPCLPYSHWVGVFSDNDVNTSLDREVPGYMGDLCSGIVREYVPLEDALDICWDEHNHVQSPAQTIMLFIVPKNRIVNNCGSSGHKTGQISIDRKPIMQETPGPITKAKGYRSW